jgi:hypothetical protein
MHTNVRCVDLEQEEKSESAPPHLCPLRHLRRLRDHLLKHGLRVLLTHKEETLRVNNK